MKFICNGKKVLAGMLIAVSMLAIIPGYPSLAEDAKVTIKDIDKGAQFAKASIISLADKNIITGDKNGYFYPLNTVKRSEMVKLLVKALGISTESLPETPTFTDVSKEHWAFEYVEAGYKAGIIKGVSEGIFGINKECSREELASMYVRALGLTEQDLKGKQPYLYINRMADKSSIANWSRENVEFALSAGLMKGVGATSFGAKLPAQRQQVAVLTERFLQSRETVNEFAGKFTNGPDYPELYQALQRIDKKFKGNVELNYQVGVSDEEGGTISSITMAAKGPADIDTDKDIMNMDVAYDMGMSFMGGLSGSMQFRLIMVDKSIYIKYSDATKWERLTKEEMEALGAPSVGSGNSSELIKYYLYGSVTREADALIRGVKATKYTMTMKPEALEAMMAGISGEQLTDEEVEAMSGIEEMTGAIEVYLDENNQVIFQTIDLTGTVQDEIMEEKIAVKALVEVFYGFDQNVAVNAPAVAEVKGQ